jgi:CheY-like chemotaxis protein
MDETTKVKSEQAALEKETGLSDKENGADLAQMEFRAQLSQQLRTPLNAIMGFAELLAMQPGAAEGKDDSIQHILRAGKEMLDIINRELGDRAEIATSDRISGAALESSQRVLYIEDDPVNYALVEQILEMRSDLELMQATNAIRGLELARTHSPRLILLDLNLPDLHGAEVLRLLQQETATARIPVVVISADATPSQIERLLTAGARNYLTKPIGIQNFLAVIDDLVEVKQGEAIS